MLSTNGEIFNRYFTVDEERTLLTHIKRFDSDLLACRDYYWMVFLRQTGLRVSNLVEFSLGDARAIVRCQRVTVRRLKKRNSKHETRDFFANKRVCSAMKNLIAVHLKMIKIDRWSCAQDDRPLLISRNQKAITVRSLELRMSNWCSSAGLSFSATPHWWRHTWAKRRLAEADDMQTLLKIQTHLDHADLKTTAIYLQPDKESMQDFLQRVV